MLKMTDFMTEFHCFQQILTENLWQDHLQNLAVFLLHDLADLSHNHLAVSTIHSDCHVTMRTGESTQRVKLETRMPCPHTLWFSRCWDVY